MRMLCRVVKKSAQARFAIETVRVLLCADKTKTRPEQAR
jgi:hypothetical protein